MSLKADYAKYGVIDGMLTPADYRNTGCSITCGGWPSWAMGAQARGWHISRIIVKECVWIKQIRAWFFMVPILSYDAIEDWPVQSYSDNTWLRDGEAPCKLDIWSNHYLHTIITHHRIRYIPDKKDRVPLQFLQTSLNPLVIEIHPNTYHGGGLLPWNLSQSWIITTCIFSPTRWVSWHLTGTEVLKVLDIPKE